MNSLDVLAQHLAGALLDIERLVAENGLLAARVGVLESALAHRESAASSVQDERRSISLKPHPKFIPVVLPPLAIDGRKRPANPATQRRLAQALKRAAGE